MRIAVAAFAVVACVACKDKQPAKQEPPAPQREVQKAPAPPSLETPAVTGPGLVQTTKLGPRITFTKTEIKLDDENVAMLTPEGTIEPARLQALTRQLEHKATSDAPIAITLDATVPYRRVGQLLDVLRRGGFRNIALLTGNGGQMIPLELPESDEVNSQGLRPVVTLDHSRLTLWSASGEEGTLRKPKLVLTVGASPSFTPLTRALGDIVQKRWPDGKRPAEDRTIIVQLDGDQPAQVLLQLLAAVRADGGVELFPNIFLAGGL